MFRKALLARGPFLLYDRLVVDWRQQGERSESYDRAKKQLADVVRVGDIAHQAGGAGPPTTVAELDRMLLAFVRSHDAQNVSAALKHLRESLQVELDTRHYNALFRVFTHAREKGQCESIMEVMVERGRFNHESIAACMNMIHMSGGKGRWVALLHAIEVVMASGLPLVHRSPCPPESSTMGTPQETAYRCGLESAPLSSLLHAACVGEEGPLAALLIVVWMRSLGVELSPFDYANLLTALSRDTEEFPHVAVTLSHDPEALKDSRHASGGWITLATVGARLRDDFDAVKAAAAGSSDVSPAKATRASRSTWFSTFSVPPLKVTALEPLLALMERSWVTYTISRTRPVYIGFLNKQWTSLDGLISHVFDEVYRMKGVGPRRQSPFDVHHFYILLMTTLGHKIEGVLEVKQVYERWVRWSDRYGCAAAAVKPRDDSLVSEGVPTETEFDVQRSETAVITDKLLRDVASFFAAVPRSVAETVAPSYKALLNVIRAHTNDLDYHFVWALGLPLASTNAELNESWDRVVKETSYPFIVRSAKQMLRSMIVTASLHPPRNAKMDEHSEAERRKWFKYNESRDMALALFGGTAAGKDAMQALYMNQNRQAAVRNRDVVERDKADFMRLFGVTPMQHRITPPVVSVHPSVTDVLPRHCYDKTIDNPFPHVRMARSADTRLLEDVFPRLQSHLRYLSKREDRFWLNDQETVLKLLRCYLHRLDWKGAASLVEDIKKHFEFNNVMDAELQRIFDEIGDPTGSIYFKMATNLFDGRIVETGRRSQMFGSGPLLAPGAVGKE